MAETNESLIRFDCIVLDVNENPSNTENCANSNDAVEQSNCSTKSENLTFHNDINICESNNSPPSCNLIEMPESTLDFLGDNLNILVDNCNEINNSNHEYGNQDSDSGIHDSENNIVEDDKLIDFTGVDLNSFNEGGVKLSDFNNEENDVQAKDEEFHDAVQFFKDPSSLTFLENVGTSNAAPDPLLTRSSLYMNFDPLHAKFCSQSVKSNELQEIVEAEIEPEAPLEHPESGNNSVPINKHLANASVRESVGNVLMSFDSPVTSKNCTDSDSVINTEPCKPPKLYTEDELQQALKIQELSVQETFLKRQHDLELERLQKEQEMEQKIQKQNLLCLSLNTTLKEVVEVACILADKQKNLQESLENAEKENVKLQEDLRISVEDLQKVESMFSDFHKRYEQCKSMLKVYTQNEDNLKQQLEAMNKQLQEKDEMYKILQGRTQEMLDKANTEVSNAKRAGEAQIAVLKAQLKKAELKISSLESDVKHVKIENGKLSSICDELMAKVSEA